MRQDDARWPRCLAVTAAAMLLTSACEIAVNAGPYSVHEEKRYSVAGTPDLQLTTFDGSMEIRSWDRAEILIEVEKRAADKTTAESIVVKADQSGNTITIDVTRPDGGPLRFRNAPSARIVASVPRRCNITARSGDGSISIERVTGRIDLHTADGSMRGFDLAGSIRVNTQDGSLRFEDIAGSIDMESGDGSARLTGKLDAVKLRTGDGSVEVRAADGSAMADDWEIRTGDGGLRIELPAAFDAMLDASTADGAVRVRGFGEPSGAGRRGDDEADSRGELRRPLNKGGKLLRLRSDSGTITVHTL
jgi:DUF4097 and DUF4098 domain-containing protein YvlB